MTWPTCFVCKQGTLRHSKNGGHYYKCDNKACGHESDCGPTCVYEFTKK